MTELTPGLQEVLDFIKAQRPDMAQAAALAIIAQQAARIADALEYANETAELARQGKVHDD